MFCRFSSADDLLLRVDLAGRDEAADQLPARERGAEVVGHDVATSVPADEPARALRRSSGARPSTIRTVAPGLDRGQRRSQLRAHPGAGAPIGQHRLGGRAIQALDDAVIEQHPGTSVQSSRSPPRAAATRAGDLVRVDIQECPRPRRTPIGGDDRHQAGLDRAERATWRRRSTGPRRPRRAPPRGGGAASMPTVGAGEPDRIGAGGCRSAATSRVLTRPARTRNGDLERLRIGHAQAVVRPRHEPKPTAPVGDLVAATVDHDRVGTARSAAMTPMLAACCPATPPILIVTGPVMCGTRC